jgi:branched-chain amino acid transport system permease protein
LAFAAAGVFIALVSDPFAARIVALVVLWALFGMSWNLIGGYLGQPSFGHATSIGLGAYTSVLLLIWFDLNAWMGAIAGGIVAAIAALLIGAPTLRLRGAYFALGTLVFPFLISLVLIHQGYQEVPIPNRTESPFLYMQWQDVRWYTVVGGSLVLAVWFGTRMLERSRLWIVFQAIRQSEETATSAGFNTSAIKLGTFMVSAFIAGVGGAIYALLLFTLTPESVFGFSLSIQSLVVALVGGYAIPLGPLLGAAILIPTGSGLAAAFPSIPGVAPLTYGLALIVVIVAAPRGLIPLGHSLVARVRGTKTARVDTAVGTYTPRAPAEAGPSSSRLGSPTRGAGDEAAPLVRVTGVGKRYGGVIAVQDLDLNVARGEFLGIAGPNGAGKSTLFDIMTGYQRPTSGRVEFVGTDITVWAPHRIARMGMRRTFQLARPISNLTVLENVALGALEGWSGSRTSLEDSAWRILDEVGLGPWGASRAGSLVPAQLRLLEVARALAGRPVVLLLDEPLAGLAKDEASLLMLMLQARCASGVAVVLVDHDIGTVSQHVQRLFVMDNGVAIANGRPDEVMGDTAVVDAYLGSRWRAAGH